MPDRESAADAEFIELCRLRAPDAARTALLYDSPFKHPELIMPGAASASKAALSSGATIFREAYLRAQAGENL